MLVTIALSFISTNLDDLLILTLLYQQAKHKSQQVKILLGQYLGIYFLTIISMLVGKGAVSILANYIHLLGLIPIILGICAFVNLFKQSESSDSFLDVTVFSVASLAISNGGDNLGVYVPLFGSMSLQEKMIALIVYGIMIPLMCIAAKNIARIPILDKLLLRYGNALVAIIFVLIGLQILFR